MSRRLRLLGGALAVLAALTALLAWLNLRGEPPLEPDPPATSAATSAATAPDAATLQRGAYLARAGNCAACHTAPGGAAYAGGRALATPFGTVYAGNLTPDADTGLGRWSAAEFRRALQHGRGRDGRLLVPAFPYTHFTLVSRADADALWAHLRQLPPVRQATPPHALRWPYGTQPALAVWRALYFRPGRFEPDPRRDAAWNRGAYLVEGLGHCAACHGGRDALGGGGRLGGGGTPLAIDRWVAPPLTDPGAAGARLQDLDDWVRLLQTGQTDRAAVQGPMAEVVAGSTQHLHPADLRAMGVYLRSHLAPPAGPARLPARDADALARGARLYTRHCADCHGAQGQGAAGAYPALAGNPTVTMADPRNLLRAITAGGFAPGTAGNPRPYGMPAFDLPHADLAALATWLRAAWGHDAPPVGEVQVLLAR